MSGQRVCDWIAYHLYNIGVENVHGIMGGGAAGLNDGFIKHGKIKYVCYHHEQGAGHAAIGESKYTGKLSVVNPTTGCGGTNCATSVLDAWQDNVPVLFLSGNVKLATCSGHINKEKNINIRKYGIQEHHIVDTYKSMTKFTKFIDDPADVYNTIIEAIEIALTGRKGPVWIDIPGDIQLSPMVFPSLEKSFKIKELSQHEIDIDKIDLLIANSERPLVLAGYGIRQSNTVEKFKTFIEQRNIPFVSTYGGRDYFPNDSKYSIGAIGQRGSRAGNFALQNADLLIVLGSSLNASAIGYDPKQFSPNSIKVYIDIDENELNKDIVKVEYQCNVDLNDFFDDVVYSHGPNIDLGFGQNNNEWIEKCNYWKEKWPVMQKEYEADNTDTPLNLYAVLDAVNKHSGREDILMGDAGSISYAGPVALNPKYDQRLIFSPAQADMGWVVPASIGVAMASNKNVIAITGDGSFMSNVQELSVIRHHCLNIKIIILNNRGYLSIKNTQQKYFENRVYGTSDKTGLEFPDYRKLADSFNISYYLIKNKGDYNNGIFYGLDRFESILAIEGPVLINCICLDNQEILPSQALKNGKQAGLHDMTPFLSDEELKNEMIVDI